MPKLDVHVVTVHIRAFWQLIDFGVIIDERQSAEDTSGYLESHCVATLS